MFPSLQCHMKDATSVFARVGDMRELPSSARLPLCKEGGSGKVLANVCREKQSPTKRAEPLAERYASAHRVGGKLATMFVSAPPLAGTRAGAHPVVPRCRRQRTRGGRHERRPGR